MTDGAHPVASILAKEFRQTCRDRSVFILVFLMPLALAVVTTLAFRNLGSAGQGTIAVVNADRGPAAAVLVDEVLPQLTRAPSGSSSDSPLIKVRALSSETAARSAVRKGDAAAAIVVPAGFSTAVAAERPSTISLVTGSSDSLGRSVAASVLDGFSAQVGTNLLSIRLLVTGTGSTRATTQLFTAANAQRNPVTIQTALAGRGTLGASSFFAPSMVILALLFCGQILARGLVAERRTRTLARIILTGTTPRSVLAAKYLMSLLTGLAAALVVLGLFAVFGAHFGSWWGLVLLCVLSATAMTSAASLAVFLSRDEEQASTLGTVVVFVLAIAGGNFVPLSQNNGALNVLALFTPNGWAVRGFADLSVASGGVLNTIGTTLLVLAGFTVVCGSASLLLSRRVLTRVGV